MGKEILWHVREISPFYSAMPKQIPVAGELVQQLRAHAALTDNLGLITSTYTVAQKQSVTPVPGDMKPYSGFCRHKACMWHTYI